MSNWFIIKTTSGQECRAERYLERMGYSNGWHPVEEVRISERIYQRLKASRTGKPPPRYKTRPIVTGYVFLPSDDVDVHRINGHHTAQLWMDVLCVNGEPYRVSDATMSQMRSVPDRLQELLDEAQRAAQAEWEAKRPIVGCEARVIHDGLYQGLVGVVSDYWEDRGEVKIDFPASIGRVSMRDTMVERVV